MSSVKPPEFRCAIEESPRGSKRCEQQCESCRLWWPPKADSKAVEPSRAA